MKDQSDLPRRAKRSPRIPHGCPQPESVRFVVLLYEGPTDASNQTWPEEPNGHHSGVSPPQRGLPTRAARNGQICPEFLLLCCRARKAIFKRKRAVSGPSALLDPGSPHHSGSSPPQRGLPTTGLGPLWGARNGQILPEFLLSWKRPFLKGNGPFLAHLPFWTRNGQICLRTWGLKLRASHLKLRTWNLKFRTWDLKLRTRGLKLRTSDLKLRTWDRE